MQDNCIIGYISTAQLTTTGRQIGLIMPDLSYPQA